MSKKKIFLIVLAVIFVTFIGYRIAKPISEEKLMEVIKTGSAQDVEAIINKTRGKNHVRITLLFAANNKGGQEELSLIEKIHPIYTAALYAKDPEIINVLAKNGVDVNPKFFNFKVYEMVNPMYAAIKINSTEGIYTNLIKNGAVHPLSNDKATWLIDAIENPNPKVLQEYIKDGSVLKEVRETTKQGEYSAFYMAAQDKNVAYQKVYLLLAYGFNPNAKSSKGNTAYQSLTQNMRYVDMDAYNLLGQYSN